MSFQRAIVVTILLISVISMAGCTGSPPSPVATPAPSPVAPPLRSTPALPTIMAAPVTTMYTWTPETPATGHPYLKTYSFSGSGDYDELTFTTTSDATWVYRLTYPRKGVFTVILKNDRGEDIEVLANTGGSGTGQKSVWLKAGNYYFNVEADAPWYITMSTP
jgi:hypothetical protein